MQRYSPNRYRPRPWLSRNAGLTNLQVVIALAMIAAAIIF